MPPMSDEEFARAAERILESQRRAVAEERRRREAQRRFAALPLVEQRCRHAIAEARHLVAGGATCDDSERALFDDLPDEVETVAVARVVSTRGLGACAPGTRALVVAQMTGWDRGQHAGRLSAERLAQDRRRFALVTTVRLLRSAGKWSVCEVREAFNEF